MPRPISTNRLLIGGPGRYPRLPYRPLGVIGAASKPLTETLGREAGWSHSVCSDKNALPPPVSGVVELIRNRVDGLILTGGNRRRAVYDMIKAIGVPLVVTWKLFLE